MNENDERVLLRPSTQEASQFKLRISHRKGEKSYGKNSTTISLYSDLDDIDEVREHLVKALSLNENVDDLIGVVRDKAEFREDVLELIDERSRTAVEVSDNFNLKKNLQDLKEEIKEL